MKINLEVCQHQHWRFGQPMILTMKSSEAENLCDVNPKCSNNGVQKQFNSMTNIQTLITTKRLEI